MSTGSAEYVRKVTNSRVIRTGPVVVRQIATWPVQRIYAGCAVSDRPVYEVNPLSYPGRANRRGHLSELKTKDRH